MGKTATACDGAWSDPGREAWWLLFQIAQAQRGVFQSTCTESALSPAQVHLLFMLEPQAPQPMSEIAQALACDASNVTGLVDKLERRRLLERQSAPRDRRVKLIALTAEGMRLREDLKNLFAEPPPAIASLSEAEKRALRDLLKKIAEHNH